MRLGLRGRVCRVWAPRGTAVSQAVQTGWKYTYVAVAIDPLTGGLWWSWQKNMKGAEMARIRGAWAAEPGIDGWVRDGAGGHKGEEMQAVDAPQVVQPPYAPELNPVERFFRELRRAIEGRVYPTLQAKQEALGRGAECLAGESGAGEAAVRLGLAPEGPEGSARRHSSRIITLDWYHQLSRYRMPWHSEKPTR